MPKNLRFDARRGTSVPYDSPTPGLAAQLQRLVTEERPDACLGCGHELMLPRSKAEKSIRKILTEEGNK